MAEVVAGLLMLGLAGSGARAQDEVVTRAEAEAAIGQISQALDQTYPFPDLAKLYDAALARGLKAGRYYGLSDCALAERLTGDLRATHKDLHLRVDCAAEHPDEAAPETLGAGHGFDAVQIDHDLPVAYIRSGGEWELSEAAVEVAEGAVAMASRARYVIIDIKGNPGGHGEIGNLLASYFFELGEAQPLVRGVYRDRGHQTLEGAYPIVPGRRLADAKLYILVDADTASAAEGFAFGLQHVKRATIIGQRTAGAGIAGRDWPLPRGLSLFLPEKLILAPDNDQGWEGVGVAPDLVTAPGEEVAAAYGLIKADLAAKGQIEDPKVLPAPAGAVQPRPVVTLAPGQPATPSLAACQQKVVEVAASRISLTNHCGLAVTLQYLTSLQPHIVYQNTLQPGETLSTRYLAAGAPGYWWIWAACPVGYFSDAPLTASRRRQIAAGTYQCVRPPDPEVRSGPASAPPAGPG